MSSERHPSTSLAWRDAAVDWVAAALDARHPGLPRALPGTLQTRRADILDHLAHLDCALFSGETSLFIDYATWLAEVLENHGRPASHLVESFDLLADFLTRADLPAADGEQRRALLAAAGDALRRGERPAAPIEPRLAPLADATRYAKAAVSGRQALAQRLMGEVLHAGLTLTEASVRLIQPAMVEIGQLWQENRISVAQEHLATAISQNVLARAYLQATFASPVGRQALFAGVVGNHHSLGLRMVADAFETIGWDVLYLGADVPIADLIRQVDHAAIDLVALSLALPSHLLVARQTVEYLRAELGSRCPPIWVGGLATQIGDRVWRTLKVDGWAADALQVLEEGGF